MDKLQLIECLKNNQKYHVQGSVLDIEIWYIKELKELWMESKVYGLSEYICYNLEEHLEYFDVALKSLVNFLTEKVQRLLLKDLGLTK